MPPSVDRKFRSACRQTPRSNGDFSPRMERPLKSGEFCDGRGSIGIGKELPMPSRGLHAMTNSGPLACAGRQTEQFDGRDLLRVFMDHKGGLIETPVIHHDHFIRLCLCVQVSNDRVEMGEDAGGLVMGRDDD